MEFLKYNIKYLSVTGVYISRRMNMKKINYLKKRGFRLTKRFPNYGHSNVFKTSHVHTTKWSKKRAYEGRFYLGASGALIWVILGLSPNLTTCFQKSNWEKGLISNICSRATRIIKTALLCVYICVACLYYSYVCTSFN